MGIGSKLLIAKAGFGSRSPPIGQGEDAQDADLPAKRQRDDIPDMHLLAGLLDALAVDASVAAFDQTLSKSAAFHQPDAVEVEVDPQATTA